MQIIGFDQKLDLCLQKVLRLTQSQIWIALTEPEILQQWFYPEPWHILKCVIDLKPGGEFSLHVKSQNGQKYIHKGDYLEVLKEEKLVWTRAASLDNSHIDHKTDLYTIDMTVIIQLAAVENGTRFSVHAMHVSEEQQQRHAHLGFETLWFTALHQLEMLYSFQQKIIERNPHGKGITV